jgi:hypothetical protein
VLMIFPSIASLAALAILFYFGRRTGEGQVALPSGIWTKMLDSADGKWAGPGSSLPSQVEGNNRSALELQTRSLVVLERDLDRGRYGKDAPTKHPFAASSQRPHRGGYYRLPLRRHPPLTSCRALVHVPEIADGRTLALAFEPWCGSRNAAWNASCSKGLASQEAGLDRLRSRFLDLE